MGGVKQKMIEWDELGICPGKGGNVCGECVDDPVLAEFIVQNATEISCSYCRRRQEEEPFTLPLGEVVEFMATIINEEWTDPANELPYETREGGYQGEVLNAFELLVEIGFEPDNYQVLEDVASFFMARGWCREDYFGATPSERVRFGWGRFCHEVMHARRYTFWTSLEDDAAEFRPDCLPPGKMLAEIESVISDLGLIREFPKGTKFWRVQDHEQGETLTPPERFTSPPLESALTPNRMSPAGIPMFYGAEDFETAVLEVAGNEAKPGWEASGVAFEALRPLQILDLVLARPPVSYFAPNGRTWRHRTEFLRYFERDVSKPIDRTKRQHIDYVPTQVFTEYVRYHMKSPDGQPVDGICYFSSRNQRACYVLSFDQDDCLKSRDGRPQSLAFVPGSMKTTSLDTPR